MTVSSSLGVTGQLAEVEALLEIEVAGHADDLADDVRRENLRATGPVVSLPIAAGQSFDRAFAGEIEVHLARDDRAAEFSAELLTVVVRLRRCLLSK